MITVIGLGFVGLGTALGFAEKGFKVYGVDTDDARVGFLRSGVVPFHEPLLDVKLVEHLECGRFTIAATLDEALTDSELVFLCVGTPQDQRGAVDLTCIESAIDSCLTAVEKNRYRVLVIKSTVPPGTLVENLRPRIEQRGWRVGNDIGLVSNPEFLREGFAWQDFITPDRIVIGVENDSRANALLANVYGSFQAPCHFVGPSTAEFIKYLSNTLLSTMISYANEMAMIAAAVGGVEVKRAFEILHGDKRWHGSPAGLASYVYPGCGYGGYCLPKDTLAIIRRAQEKGYEPSILKSVQAVNHDIKLFVVEKLKARAEVGQLIGILGLSFKPGSDDVRDTPALHVIRGLLSAGYSRIGAHDPLAIRQFQDAYGDLPLTYWEDMNDLAEKADIMILLTAWDDYKSLVTYRDKILDFRNII